MMESRGDWTILPNENLRRRIDLKFVRSSLEVIVRWATQLSSSTKDPQDDCEENQGTIVEYFSRAPEPAPQSSPQKEVGTSTKEKHSKRKASPEMRLNPQKKRKMASEPQASSQIATSPSQLSQSGGDGSHDSGETVDLGKRDDSGDAGGDSGKKPGFLKQPKWFPGDIVWAQIDSMWWPGVVELPKNLALKIQKEIGTGKPQQNVVWLFAEKGVQWVDERSLLPYNDVRYPRLNEFLRICSRKKVSKFLEAIQIADKTWKAQCEAEAKEIEQCWSCGNIGFMICCDLCPAFYCNNCLDLPANQETEKQEEWICKRCLALNEYIIVVELFSALTQGTSSLTESWTTLKNASVSVDSSGASSSPPPSVRDIERSILKLEFRTFKDCADKIIHLCNFYRKYGKDYNIAARRITSFVNERLKLIWEPFAVLQKEILERETLLQNSLDKMLSPSKSTTRKIHKPHSGNLDKLSSSPTNALDLQRESHEEQGKLGEINLSSSVELNGGGGHQNGEEQDSDSDSDIEMNVDECQLSQLFSADPCGSDDDVSNLRESGEGVTLANETSFVGSEERGEEEMKENQEILGQVSINFNSFTKDQLNEKEQEGEIKKEEGVEKELEKEGKSEPEEKVKKALPFITTWQLFRDICFFYSCFSSLARTNPKVLFILVKVALPSLSNREVFSSLDLVIEETNEFLKLRSFDAFEILSQPHEYQPGIKLLLIIRGVTRILLDYPHVKILKGLILVPFPKKVHLQALRACTEFFRLPLKLVFAIRTACFSFKVIQQKAPVLDLLSRYAPDFLVHGPGGADRFLRLILLDPPVLSQLHHIFSHIKSDFHVQILFHCLNLDPNIAKFAWKCLVSKMSQSTEANHSHLNKKTQEVIDLS